MAFENYPETSNTPANTSVVSKEEKKSLRNILIGGLLVALLGTWGYIIYDRNNAKVNVQQKETVIATTLTERDQLRVELEDAARRYDELKTGNVKKDATITEKDKEIADKKAKIQQLLTKVNATQEDLAEAKMLIRSLNGDIDGYKQQIYVLQEQKEKLINEKAYVTQERDRARKEYDSSNLVIKEKESVIDMGSTLHASNFSIVGINEKRNGKEKTTSKAKRVDKLRISFDLDENMIAKSGTKEVFVCITDPTGNPIAVQALGSGTFNERGGAEKPYTQKLEVNYTQSKRQTVSFDWKQNSNFDKGNYKIEVYNNGFKVGEGYKELKKSGLFS